jgi:hypothetical protein
MLVSFFVANNAAATFDRIPDGTYRVQYALGKKLVRDCGSFLNLIAAAEIPNSPTFVTSFVGIEVNYQILNYELEPVSSGRAYPNAIGAGAFNAR